MLNLDDYEANFLREWRQIPNNYLDEKKDLSNQLDQLKQSYYLQALKIEEMYEDENVEDIIGKI